MAVLFSEDMPAVRADAICLKCGRAIALMGRCSLSAFRGWCVCCVNAWLDARRQAAAREPEF